MHIEVLANVGDDRVTSGSVEVQEFNQSDRTRLALKKIAIFWGASILSVLIPVFHFVSVPLLFLLGIYFAFKAFKTEGRVLSGLTICPHCDKKVTIEKAELQWPLREICQNCARVLRIERK